MINITLKRFISAIVFGFLYFQFQISKADSIGVFQVDTLQYIIHQVEGKETLYGLSKRYKNDLELIYQLNPHVKETLLRPDMLLRFLPTQKKTEFDVDETLLYNPTKTGLIMYDSLAYYEEKKQIFQDSFLIKSTDTTYHLSKRRGIAIVDEQLEEFLALSPYFEVGSYVEVTNLVNAESFYVKIIGRITKRDWREKAVLIISKQTANYLNATNERFFTEIKYFEPNN